MGKGGIKTNGLNEKEANDYVESLTPKDDVDIL